MNDVEKKLERYLKDLPFEYEWFGSVNETNNATQERAVVNYTVQPKRADATFHWARVTLRLYIVGHDDFDGKNLLWSKVDDTEIDENWNEYNQFERDVLIV